MRIPCRPLPFDRPVPPPAGTAVWQFRLADVPREWEDALSKSERNRAARYTLPRPRAEFAAGRAAVRRVLGGVLGCPPAAVPLALVAGGKPVATGVDWHFNLSHSGGFALLAVGRRPVGVDLECVRPVANAAGLVARFFSAAENSRFTELPDELRPAAFFRGWTAKEALLKAVGRGLAGLDDCAVELDPRRPLAILRFDAGWRVAEWPPWPGFAAAVAAESGAPIEVIPAGV